MLAALEAGGNGVGGFENPPTLLVVIVEGSMDVVGLYEKLQEFHGSLSWYLWEHATLGSHGICSEAQSTICSEVAL
jgi:hypothetical protein